MKRRLLKRRHGSGSTWIVVFRRNALGRLEVTLPSGACEGLGPPGSRVWFAARRGGIEVSRWPRGPRPTPGRRSTRMRRPRGRPNGGRYAKRK